MRRLLAQRSYSYQEDEAQPDKDLMTVSESETFEHGPTLTLRHGFWFFVVVHNCFSMIPCSERRLEMKHLAYFVTALLVTAAFSPFAAGHFKLLEPQSWLNEAPNGDPQKMAPCGGTSANPGTPSNAVTKVRGCTKLHLKIQETVHHPGHYRVALAVNSRSELPKDPEVTTREGARGPMSVSAVIQNPARPPILADRRYSEYQLREVHAADYSIHGGTRAESGWRLFLPSLCGLADYGRSGKAG
jgi:hypothetical protein